MFLRCFLGLVHRSCRCGALGPRFLFRPFFRGASGSSAAGPAKCGSANDGRCRCPDPFAAGIWCSLFREMPGGSGIRNGRKRTCTRIPMRVHVRLRSECSSEGERCSASFCGFGRSVRLRSGAVRCGCAGGKLLCPSAFFRHFFRPTSRTSSPPHRTAEVAPMTSPQSPALSGTVRNTSPPHVTMANCPTRINASTPRKA